MGATGLDADLLRSMQPVTWLVGTGPLHGAWIDAHTEVVDRAAAQAVREAPAQLRWQIRAETSVCVMVRGLDSSFRTSTHVAT